MRIVLNILQCQSSCLLVRECVCIRVRNCFVLMGAPSPDECYMLRNWDTGIVCGFWIRIGREMLAVDYRGLGQDMFSDYVPFNMDGEILAFNQNAKGYWRFNLPLARGKQVRFHRRLLQDVLTTTHSVYAPRYSTRRAELRRFPFGRKGNLRSSGLAVTLNIADHWVAFRKQSSRCRLARARVVRDCDAAWLIFLNFSTPGSAPHH